MKLKIIAFLLFPLIGFSQQNNPTPTDSIKPSNVFMLGEVIVTNHQNKDTLNRVTSKTMVSQNKMDVSRALNMLPGITLTASWTAKRIDGFCTWFRFKTGSGLYGWYSRLCSV
jgi:iron complex outermembrane receptor protein